MSKIQFIAESLIVAAILLGGLAGCYQHVVRVDGASAGQYDVYEPNLKDKDKDSKSSAQSRLDKKAPSKTIESKVAP